MSFNRFNVLKIDDDSDKSTTSWRIYKSKPFMFHDRKKVKRDNKNLKKILCHNMITNGTCNYGQKCLYAHSLDDQNIDSNRNHAYEILLGDFNLEHIDLQKDHSLYRSLLGLTKVCEQCNTNKCTGGYNCKFGACAKKFQVCLRDLNYGDCQTNGEICESIHLSKRGLKPFYNNSSKSYVTTDVQGTLLSSDFFKKLSPLKSLSDDEILSEISSDSSDNNYFSDECNQSIFDKI